MTSFRRMGDFVPWESDPCLCGHGVFDHGGAESSPCSVGACGCVDFEYADPDNDFYPGRDDDDEQEER